MKSNYPRARDEGQPEAKPKVGLYTGSLLLIVAGIIGLFAFGLSVIRSGPDQTISLSTVLVIPTLLLLSLAVVTVIKTLDWHLRYKSQLVAATSFGTWIWVSFAFILANKGQHPVAYFAGSVSAAFATITASIAVFCCTVWFLTSGVRWMAKNNFGLAQPKHEEPAATVSAVSPQPLELEAEVVRTNA